MKCLPVALPWLGEEEAAAVREAILSGWVTQGPRVRTFEEAFAAMCRAPEVCAVSSCTAALHLALLGVGVTRGDTVVTVSHSFIATANAVRHCGAEPFFVDVSLDTGNMDPDALERVLAEEFEERDGGLWLRRSERLALGESPWVRTTPPLGRLAAILVVHQLGLPADLGRLLPLAGRYDIPVVEDAACAAGSAVRPRPDADLEPVGRPHGRAACFSLHPRKVITTGDGGLIATADPELARRFRLLRQHGMSLSDLDRHAAPAAVERYLLTGFNYRLTDIQAAAGLVQLQRLPELLARRREQARTYAALLADLEGLTLPSEPGYARHNWQSYQIRLAPGIDRDGVMTALARDGISTKPGVMNAHAEPPYAQAWPRGTLPASEACRAQGLMLPLFHAMTGDDQARVARSLRTALGRA